MIGVVLQDEDGNMLSDQVCVAADLVSHIHDTRFTCLRYVDPYGDTVFNRYQVADLLEDLRILRAYPQSEEHEDTFRQIEKLIEQCEAEPHRYIKFIGD